MKYTDEVKYGIIKALCTYDLTEYQIKCSNDDTKIITLVLEPKKE